MYFSNANHCYYVWPQKKNNGMKNKKHTCQQWKNLLVSNTLKKLHKDIKDVMCNIAQVGQISGMLLIWAVHIYNEPWGSVQCILIFFLLRKLNIVVWEISIFRSLSPLRYTTIFWDADVSTKIPKKDKLYQVIWMSKLLIPPLYFSSCEY